MSVQGEINRIKDAVSDSYSAVSDKGGETPTTQNVANLAQAIRSIPTSPDESVFFAEYNVTTYDQITEAINNGKFVVCVYGNRTYILDNSSANSHYFYAIPKTITNWPGIQCNKTGQYLWQSSIFSTHIESDYNKKTAIDDTTKNSNTYYPTTKAVYDFVNGQKAVFIAEYGVTTYQEILDAYNSGKIVLCRDANKIYQLNSTYGPAIIFSLCYDDVSFNVQCDPDNIWMRIQWTLERRTNKTQIISSSSTTSEYPSAKAVYDYIQSLDAREVSY